MLKQGSALFVIGQSLPLHERFLKPESGAHRRCRSLVSFQSTSITTCWNGIFAIKKVLPTPTLIINNFVQQWEFMMGYNVQIHDAVNGKKQNNIFKYFLWTCRYDTSMQSSSRALRSDSSPLPVPVQSAKICQPLNTKVKSRQINGGSGRPAGRESSGQHRWI